MPETRSERLLVAGHPFRGYVRMIAAGFERCGVRTEVLEWNLPQRSFIDHAMRATSRKRVRRGNEEMSIANALALEKAIIGSSHDYVLVMNGGTLTKTARSYCTQNRVKLVLWAYDSASNFPWIVESSRDYDLIYSFEPHDLERLSEHVQAKFLPLAYDPDLYFPTHEPKDRTVDICFVGAIRKNYPERTEYLRGVVKNFPNSKIEIRSDETPWYSPFRKQDFLIAGLNRKVRVNRKQTDHSENNSLYGRSKICLNVHNNQSQRALNPRTFETMGSAGFLLTDRDLREIPDFLDGRHYVSYSGFGDLLEKTKLYLNEDDVRENIAESGHAVARNGHTYSHRASTILEDLRRT